jgi:hypothetical protein
MPQATWNLEWLNHNSQRHYPLTDEASGWDTTDSFNLPESFLVELDLPIHAGLDVDPAKFFIKHIGVYGTGYSIVVGYDADGGAIDVATALINRNTHTLNQTYALGGVGDFDDTFGKLTIGRLDSIESQPDGFFTFEVEETRLTPSAIRPIIRGVSSISVRSGPNVSARLTGDIELQPGQNMQIVPILVAGEDPILRFSAISGEGLIEECVCEGEAVGPPIRRINGVPPTAAGDFTLLGNECLEVNAVDNGLRLEDVCSEPCCGCVELEAITRDLEAFGAKATTLENFLVRLESSVANMDQVVLGAVLRDRGCITCDEETPEEEAPA